MITLLTTIYLTTLPITTPPVPTVQAEVIRIIDGDTIDVRAYLWPGLTQVGRIRLGNADTPERKAQGTCERRLHDLATAVTTELTGGPGKKIYLRQVRGKCLDRDCARIILPDGRDLGDLLRADPRGIARNYKRGDERPWSCKHIDSD